MSEFKVGDKVIRSVKHRSDFWRGECREHGVDPDGVYTVTDFKGGKYARIKIRGMPDSWDADKFEHVLPPTFSLDDYL